MAKMNATRTLRDAPFGNDLGIPAAAGRTVKLLDDQSNQFWVKIEIPGENGGSHSGWVSAQAVDQDAAVPKALDKALFAAECVFQALTFRVMAHYLMAIAQLRTDVVDGDHAIGYGPFSLSEAEWTKYSENPEFDLSMDQTYYKDWTAQCIVFAVMTNITHRRLASLLGNEPTAAQLALAQMIGSKATLQAIRGENARVEDILATVGDAELSSEGLDIENSLMRYTSFLKGKTGGEALKAVADALQAALDETKGFITKAGADLIEFANEISATQKKLNSFTSAILIGEKTVRYSSDDGTTMVKKGGSISWRQNNPGNISNGKFATNNGAIGKGNRFAIFPSEDVGFSAILKLLTNEKYGALSLDAAMHNYAPPEENDTETYIKFLVAQTNIPRTAILGELEPEQLKSLATAIKKHEGWIVGLETRGAPQNLTNNNDVTADMVVRAALTEWQHWGKSTHNLITKKKTIFKDERSVGYAEYVYDNYYRAAVKNPSPAHRDKQIARIKDNSYPWSACAMSYFMKTAGYSENQFKFSASHSVYIRDSIASKKNEDQSACFWGYRISEIEPAVGDLIGYARAKNIDFDKAQSWYDMSGSYDSHTDLVVAVRLGEIDVIGGNVSDSVTMKTLAVDPSTGLVTDRTFPWFVVMKRRLAS